MYIYSETKQNSWSSSTFCLWCFLLGLVFIFRFCATATSSSCLVSSLFERCGECCAFPTGNRDGVRLCYPVFVKTTVIFVLTTENCDVSDQVANTKDCLQTCAVAQKKREGMLSRVSNVCVNWQRGGGREEKSALSDVWWLLEKLESGTFSKAPAAPKGSGPQRLQSSQCSRRDEKLNHGIMEWFGLEETFQGDLKVTSSLTFNVPGMWHPPSLRAPCHSVSPPLLKLFSLHLVWIF